MQKQRKIRPSQLAWFHQKRKHMESCVRCHEDTGVPVSVDISQRLFYIEGAGQLCSDCFNVLYPDTPEKYSHDLV